MTREEAIQWLTNEKWKNANNKYKKEWNEVFEMAIEALSEPINCIKCKHYYETEDDTGVHGHCRMDTAHTNLISRADAIEAVASADETNGTVKVFSGFEVIDILKALPSADAEPTVIRSRTLLPTKDFKEWAKRIKEVNPNAVVIPCDAEVVSADAVHGEWIFNPTDAIDLMFAKPKCSRCGFESSDGGNYCSNCGARMKGGAEE